MALGESVTAPLVSVAFPVFNEAENLEKLHAEVTSALETTGLAFEMIFVATSGIKARCWRALATRGETR